MNFHSGARPDPSPLLQVGLWASQVVLALFFVIVGYHKLTLPIPELAAHLAWTGEVPPLLARFTALADMAGGLGILLPALTRILPRLTVAAAVGLTVLQLLAIGFHLVRGEFGLILVNLGLLALILFVWWGRAGPAPVLPR